MRAGVEYAIALFPNEPLLFESLGQTAAVPGGFDRKLCMENSRP